MDGIARAGAAGVNIRIPKGWTIDDPFSLGDGFDEYWMPPMRLEEYAVVEQHLLKHRVSPVDAVMPELERLAKIGGKAARRFAKALEEKAYQDLRKSRDQNKLTTEQVGEWLDTPAGVLFTMKLCLSRSHPGITDAEVKRIFEWQGFEEAKRQRDIAQGTDHLGNSTGPSPAAGTGPASPDASTGGASTAGSPASTAGPPTG